MRQMRADATLELQQEQRAELEKVARSRRTPQAVAQRARIVLMTAEGISPGAIGEQLGVSQPTVRKWRARYVEGGLAGLRNEPRPGRPRTLDDQRVADLLNKALQTRPAKQTHWSVRSFAAEASISKDMAHRLFRAASIAPHRSRSFKLSNDPAFVEKVRDITGLYLNPPDHALVLCVDEKSQIQALERTQPLLPMGLGYVEGVTHDYVRHGTTTLFAALDVANGQVISRVRKHHRHQEFLDFLRQIDKQTPPRLGSAPDRGQLRHPQARQGQGMASAPPALPDALHAHLQFVAQSGRALVRADHGARHSAQLIHQRARTQATDRPVRAALQRRRLTVPVGRYRRLHPSEDRENREAYFCDRTLAAPVGH